MKRIRLALATLICVLVLCQAIPASSADVFTYITVGQPALDSDGIAVTVTKLELNKKIGSTQLNLAYRQQNQTLDKKLDEGQFKIFFTDGTSEAQYGFFNPLFPSDFRERTYTWEWLNSKEPWMIEWKSDFFASTPKASNLRWKVGDQYPATPSPKPESKPTIEWKVQGSKLVVTVVNGIGRTFNAQLWGQAAEEVITVTPYVRKFTAYSGRLGRIFVEGLPAELVPLSATEGISANQSFAPRIDGIWVGQVATFRGTNLALGSEVEILRSGLSVSKSITKSNAIAYSMLASPADIFNVLVDGDRMSTLDGRAKFSNCVQVWKVFDGGIARSSKILNKGSSLKRTPTIYSSGYALNSTLDKDKDNLVCER